MKNSLKENPSKKTFATTIKDESIGYRTIPRSLLTSPLKNLSKFSVNNYFIRILLEYKGFCFEYGPKIGRGSQFYKRTARKLEKRKAVGLHKEIGSFFLGGGGR